MMDLDRELWRLGIPAKTRHNEVAPGQFEMAPVFEPTSVGSDHNMIVMATHAPDRAAARPRVPHPREAVRRHQRLGQAQQLVDVDRRGREPARPGHRPARQRAVPGVPDRRSSARSTSTPTSSARRSPTPARTTAWAPTRRRRRSCRSSSARSSRTSSTQIEKGAASASKKGGNVELGVTSLPVLPKDATDRNRTSPFAFTGNKFEFRAVGSSAPIYWPQTVLNTAVADSLQQLADELDKLKPGDFDGLTKVLSAIVKDHKQVLFEGNGYSEEWHAEAERRGLPNNRTTVDALPALTTKRAKALFSPVRRAVRARARRRASRSTGSATSRSRTSRRSCALDIARTMILRGIGAVPGPALPSASVVAWRGVGLRAGRGPHGQAGRRDRRARARPARGARGRLGRGGGEGLRRGRDPGAGRAARGRRRARDGRRPTTSGRCRSTASCCSSTRRSGAARASVPRRFVARGAPRPAAPALRGGPARARTVAHQVERAGFSLRTPERASADGQARGRAGDVPRILTRSRSRSEPQRRDTRACRRGQSQDDRARSCGERVGDARAARRRVDLAPKRSRAGSASA